MEKNIEDMILSITNDSPYKIIISKIRKNTQNECVKINILRKSGYYQAEKYTETQVFHEKIEFKDLFLFCINELQTRFLQMNSWSDNWQMQLVITKKGNPFFNKRKINEFEKPSKQEEHNRPKNYIITEGTVVQPLVDMGIFTKAGKVVAGKYDKYKQINRILEIIDDSIKMYWREEDQPLRVVDFGCGKSYLTFIVYYYLTEIKKIKVSMIGLDLKENVIKKCNESAERYGYTDLVFKVGDISCYDDDCPADLVMTLHACDTATDYALYHAITWKTKMIFSVPCCQHELNKQFEAKELEILGRYGIVKERVNALMTDAIRANLLEYCGYRTQLMEFVDFENTPKNILIRAVMNGVGNGVKKINLFDRNKYKEKYLIEVKELMQTFGYKPTLYRLLSENGFIKEQ